MQCKGGISDGRAATRIVTVHNCWCMARVASKQKIQEQFAIDLGDSPREGHDFELGQVELCLESDCFADLTRDILGCPLPWILPCARVQERSKNINQYRCKRVDAFYTAESEEDSNKVNVTSDT